MNLMYTFQAKPQADPRPIPKIYPASLSHHPSQKSFLPPISSTNIKSARVLPYISLDRQNLKTDLGASRPKFTENPRTINSSSSSLNSQFTKIELRKIFEEPEPKTPTFKQDEKFEELVNLNRKIEKVYKTKRKVEVRPLGRYESMGKIEKEKKMVLKDFPFFVTSTRNAEELGGRRGERVGMKTRREHPRVHEGVSGLPQGVFTVKDF